MRFVRDDALSGNRIRAYGNGEIHINEQRLRSGVIVSDAELVIVAGLRSVDDLRTDHQDQLLRLAPEIVLIGSGQRQRFPEPAFGARFMAAGIGFEVMDTGAACRTFNVLVSEGRQVAALLIVEDHDGEEKKRQGA